MSSSAAASCCLGGTVAEKNFLVRLSEAERATLSAVVASGKPMSARKRMRAQVLLNVDQGEHGPAWTDERAAQAAGVHLNTVRTIRRQFVERGFELILERLGSPDEGRKKFVVRLSEAERSKLSEVVATKKPIAARTRMRAQVLLKIDQGEHGPAWTDEKAAEAFDVDPSTVRAIRRQLVERGFEAVLERKKQSSPSRKRVLDAKGDEQLLAIAQSSPPAGRARWTLQLLAGEIVRLNIAPEISYETVRTRLKKTRSNRTSKWHG